MLQDQFEKLIGGSGDDTLTGNGPGTVITGGPGNDVIAGGGGAMQLHRHRQLRDQPGRGEGGTNLTINWTDPNLLQQATNVLGPWISLLNATPPFQFRLTNSISFFRLGQ